MLLAEESHGVRSQGRLMTQLKRFSEYNLLMSDLVVPSQSYSSIVLVTFISLPTLFFLSHLLGPGG
jgi:hypothetical protein